jgi:hypothetical protein
MAEGEYEERRNFNRDLDSYLSTRKKKRISLKSIFGRSRHVPAELPPEVRSYGGPKEEKKEAKKEEVPKEGVDDAVLEEEYKKELTCAERGVLSRVFGFLRSKPGEVEQQVDNQGNVVGGTPQETEQRVQKEFKDFEAEERLGEKPLEENRGLFAGLARFLGLRANAPDYEEEVIGGVPESSQMAEQPPKEDKREEVKSDMKNIAKISADILKKLDPKKLEEFKKTPDFDKFKEILKKHNMIR